MFTNVKKCKVILIKYKILLNSCKIYKFLKVE